MPTIRPFRPGDEDAIIHIFRKTAAPELVNDPNPDTLHIASFLWARPYFQLRPDWCTVIDDGTPVGYLLCAPDTASFVEDYRNFDAPQSGPAKLQRLIREPENMLHAGTKLVVKYPAHIHIDILPEYQSQGFGQKLMEELFQRLRDQGIAGVHLGMVADNSRAGKFYTKLGFRPFEEMNDGQLGKEGNSIYMVRAIE